MLLHTKKIVYEDICILIEFLIILEVRPPPPPVTLLELQFDVGKSTDGL